MSQYAALTGRIRTGLSDVKNASERAILLADKATKTGDDGYWDGVALNLHGYYTGVEHIFKDVARTMEANLPTGPEWHLDLLTQMSSEIDGIRPAVISRATRECLDEYRGFRHLVRNIYALNLRPARLRELVDNLRPCFKAVSEDLEAFTAFLAELE